MKYFIEPMKKNHEVDIFLHMWDLNKDIIENLDVKFKMRESKYDKLEFMYLLKPKKYCITQFNKQTEKIPMQNLKMDNKKFIDKNYSSNAIGMYYNIYQANLLKKKYEDENNFKYDFCWRARLDFIFEDYITPEDCDNYITSNTIYLISDRYATNSGKITNDKFWGGKNEVIDAMCEIYNKIPEYYKNDINIEGQTLTMKRMSELNLNKKLIGHQYTYYKCQGRHDISNKGIGIKLYNIPLELHIELAYLLLYDGYKVIGPYNLLLNCFQNYHNQGEGTRVIITTTPRKEDFSTGYKKRILIGEDIYDSYVTLNINKKNIKMINVAKFIHSLIKFSTPIEYFNFQKEEKISYDIGEEVKYRIADRGYTAAKVTNFENNKVIFNKVKIDKSNVFVTNKVKFYKEGILPID
ncbi:MAG: hypothetical protein CMF62_01860 [Magnetococcales bacterium]|nr:hypothetical protein [Magnetococcales bacterium]|tara:strand:- start:31272 stop:32498 length:1227 start_codon:yes stop_codon:yes gene_type:complete